MANACPKKLACQFSFVKENLHNVKFARADEFKEVFLFWCRSFYAKLVPRPCACTFFEASVVPNTLRRSRVLGLIWVVT